MVNFGLEIYELLDSSSKAIAIMYVHFINAMGRLTTRFLCHKELPEDSSADDVHHGVIEALDESELDLQKL